MNIKIDFAKSGGLVPAIAQDAATNEVLMLAYMDENALNLTLKTGFAHYYSRSRNSIWKKGEQSGHTQEIVDIILDCDNDTILLKVKQNGVACHTGNKTCFFKSLMSESSGDLNEVNSLVTPPNYQIIDQIYHTILDRKLNGDPNTSYVAKLFSKGENSILKKICEEAGEFAFACKDLSKAKIYSEFNKESFGEHKKGDPKYDAVYEGADLIFHMLVALCLHGIHPSQIYDELRRREGISGIDEKNSRKG
ncbi:MAG: bifunctional phosphoribosyl-AMP cyclohydrolase/phosphoribosyl-ATP diphosphatase HisIE [Campylobacter sp.]|nr:bifunctional phosphoribosyl-AMP cyclohydrolase/phosphoribosyl-ATP diphosphatase HisIE [Campylobacter sp.]